MKRVRFFLVVLALALVHALAEPGSAAAATVINSPFGPSTPVFVMIGANASAPVQAIAWQRRSDGACLSTLIGDQRGLFDDYEVAGSSGNDVIRVLYATDAATSFCNFRLWPLVYNGHYLDLYGRQGVDVLTAGTGDTWMFGEDGNDGLKFGGMGSIYGNAGNDNLVAASSAFASEGLYGGAGNDCLEDRSGAAGTVDCGAGTDNLVTAFGEPISVGCESRRSTSCPEIFSIP